MTNVFLQKNFYVFFSNYYIVRGGESRSGVRFLQLTVVNANMVYSASGVFMALFLTRTRTK